MTEDIFEVKINEEGYKWLQRFGNLSLAILVITLLVNGLTLYKTIPMVIKANTTGPFESSFRFRNFAFIGFIVCNCVLQVAQIFLYRRFAVTAQYSIDNSNTMLFNHSFRLLYRQSILFLVQMLMGFAYFVYTFYGNKF